MCKVVYVKFRGVFLLQFPAFFRILQFKMPKKTKGINKPLGVSVELANIIGTKKGEQVWYLWLALCSSFVEIRCPGHRWSRSSMPTSMNTTSRWSCSVTMRRLTHLYMTGSWRQELLLAWQSHAAHLWRQETQAFRDDQALQGPSDWPQEVICKSYAGARPASTVHQISKTSARFSPLILNQNILQFHILYTMSLKHKA